MTIVLIEIQTLNAQFMRFKRKTKFLTESWRKVTHALLWQRICLHSAFVLKLREAKSKNNGPFYFGRTNF